MQMLAIEVVVRIPVWRNLAPQVEHDEGLVGHCVQKGLRLRRCPPAIEEEPTCKEGGGGGEGQ